MYSVGVPVHLYTVQYVVMCSVLLVSSDITIHLRCLPFTRTAGKRGHSTAIDRGLTRLTEEETRGIYVCMSDIITFSACYVVIKMCTVFFLLCWPCFSVSHTQCYSIVSKYELIGNVVVKPIAESAQALK